ncbi:MAG: hypothetical protein KDE31_19755 [Caldilineaceae bacterium]|nr:hypothetical protein [Caldilineaceae bacterium]
MFTLPLTILALLVDLTWRLFLSEENGLNWIAALFLLGGLILFCVVVGVAIGNFLFNL